MKEPMHVLMGRDPMALNILLWAADRVAGCLGPNHPEAVALYEAVDQFQAYQDHLHGREPHPPVLRAQPLVLDERAFLGTDLENDR